MGRDKAPKPKSTKGSGSGSKNGEELLDPREIRFTHSRIRPFFSCGRKVNETLEDVKAGKIAVAQLPKITVIRQDDMYYSMNNRRLYVFKQLREAGLLPGDKVPQTRTRQTFMGLLPLARSRPWAVIINP
jgi:hypothetical protein